MLHKIEINLSILWFGLDANLSMPQESVPAAEEDSIIDTDSEGEITSARKQRSPDPPKGTNKNHCLNLHQENKNRKRPETMMSTNLGKSRAKTIQKQPRR